MLLRWICAVCIFAAFAVASASQRAETNAFLATHVNSVSQLIEEVSRDGAVADRYERHFGKKKSELVVFFGTLHTARLNSAGTYRIYSVLDNGSIKAHVERLKAGTRVFADASGMPVLKLSCGNAMMTGTDAQTTALSPSVTGQTNVLQTVSLTTPESQIVTNQSEVLTPGSPIALSPEFPNSPGQVSTGNRNQGYAGLPALLAAIGGAAGVSIGSHGGSTPVPEPATVVVMIGMIAAIKLRRRNK